MLKEAPQLAAHIFFFFWGVSYSQLRQRSAFNGSPRQLFRGILWRPGFFSRRPEMDLVWQKLRSPVEPVGSGFVCGAVANAVGSVRPGRREGRSVGQRLAEVRAAE